MNSIIRRRRISRRHPQDRADRGATAIEVAIIFPLFLMLVFGLMWFGIGVAAQIGVTRAARDGARHLAITGDVVAAEQAALDAAGTIDPDRATFTSTPCPEHAAETDTASLAVSYPFEYTIPMFGTRTVTLTGSAVAKCR